MTPTPASHRHTAARRQGRSADGTRPRHGAMTPAPPPPHGGGLAGQRHGHRTPLAAFTRHASTTTAHQRRQGPAAANPQQLTRQAPAAANMARPQGPQGRHKGRKAHGRPTTPPQGHKATSGGAKGHHGHGRTPATDTSRQQGGQRTAARTDTSHHQPATDTARRPPYTRRPAASTNYESKDGGRRRTLAELVQGLAMRKSRRTIQADRSTNSPN